MGETFSFEHATISMAPLSFQVIGLFFFLFFFLLVLLYMLQSGFGLPACCT